MYKLTTWERSYDKSDAHYNVLEMDDKKFSEFLAAVRITDEKEENEDGEVIDKQTVFVFNSGLRHTACKVIRIEEDGKVLYLYHHNPELRKLSPKLCRMMNDIVESEAA